MSSIGEVDLTFNSRTIGKVRARYIYPDPALYPRLGIELGVSLFEISGAAHSSPDASLTGIELRGLSGELRTVEHGPVISNVQWMQRPRVLRSYAYVHEHSVKVVCDLDHLRIQQLEEIRKGMPPQFWLQLWPTLVSSGELLEADIRAIPLQIPRESWLDFLSRTRSDQYEVIEVRFRPEEAAAYRSALDHVRTAQAKLNDGDSNAAVGACRLALDALTAENPRISSELRGEEVKGALWKLAEERSHAKSVEQYRTMFGKLQSLTSTVHHHYGAHVEFRRSEAQFAIRMTEALVALVGDLTAGE